MELNWEQALKLEQSMFHHLVGQKRRGVLVDQPLMAKHIETLDNLIQEIDDEALPQLPMRLVCGEQKKNGVFGWLKKPFLKNGKLSQASEKWVASTGYDTGDISVVGGPFSRIVFDSFELGSLAQVKDYLLSQGWVPDKWNYSTLTGERTSPILSDSDEFIGVRGDLGLKVAQRAKYRHRKSLLEGLQRRIRPDGRITAGVTGLCPTARLKHQGVVNIPGVEAVFGQECREIFIAPEGYNIIGCDAKSCQLRMLAHYMGDDEYIRAILADDPHLVNMRLAGLTKKRDAKTLIYAFLFGAKDPKLAAGLRCSVREAKKVRAKLLAELPKLAELITGLERVWKQRGYLIGLDGRAIYVRAKHMLLNYLLQSAEAIMMKVATCYAIKSIEKEGYDAQMIIHMHDEFQFEVLKEHSKDVAELLEESIVNSGTFFNLNIPMGGDASIGKSWADTH